MLVDEIYLNIAQKIIDNINDEWNFAKITFEYLGSAAEYQGKYYKNTEQSYDFKVGYPIYKLFKELHTITTEDSENKWNRALFSLEPTGKFNSEFEWDQDLSDEINIEIIPGQVQVLA